MKPLWTRPLFAVPIVTIDAFPEGFTKGLDLPLTLFLRGICDMQAFSKPRSPMSTDYNVILDSENPNNLLWSEATDNTSPQIIV